MGVCLYYNKEELPKTPAFTSENIPEDFSELDYSNMAFEGEDDAKA